MPDKERGEMKIFTGQDVEKTYNVKRIPMEAVGSGGYLTVKLKTGQVLNEIHLKLLEISTEYYRDSNTGLYHFFSITKPPGEWIDALKDS